MISWLYPSSTSFKGVYGCEKYGKAAFSGPGGVAEISGILPPSGFFYRRREDDCLIEAVFYEI